MLESLIAESTDYDFKETVEVNKPKSWLKSVSAFANGTGGTLFFGVKNDRTLVGLENSQKSAEKISELIKARIEPIPVFLLIPHSEDGKAFLELNVKPGTSTPYYYHADGVRIAFSRMGDESIETPSYLLNELILRGRGQTYDSVETGYRKKDFAFTMLNAKFKERTKTDFTDEDFLSFGLSTEKGLLTNAGVLFADDNPLRQSRLFCTKWNGLNKTNEDEAGDDLEISGSLIRQLTMAMDFFRANTKRRWHKEKMETVYEPDYDEEAIMEALVNGIIHRDYSIQGGEVTMNIYDDRIEITSPGGTYSGKKIPAEVKGSVPSIRRNPIIADLFWKMGYMNRRGSGLAKITARTNDLFHDGRGHVFYHSDELFFYVTIENANAKNFGNDGAETGNDGNDGELLEEERAVLALINSNDRITLQEIADSLKVSKRTASRIVGSLKSRGKLGRRGSAKSGRWMLQ